jgi:c-di-GMP-binding flagellar brake protein YcgR
MNNLQQDRRKFIRLKAYHLAKYKILNTRDPHPVTMLAAIRDIGAGGVCMRTKEPVPVASVIEIQIKFPTVETPIFTVARVVWVKQKKKHKFFEIGAQFIEIEESARKMIDEHVKVVSSKLKKEEKPSLFERIFCFKKK